MVNAFFLKFQMDKRKNALAVDPAKGKTGEKGCTFHLTVEMKQPQTITEPLCLSNPCSQLFWRRWSLGGCPFTGKQAAHFQSKRLCYSVRCFYPNNLVTYGIFFNLPLAGFMGIVF